MRAVFAVFCVAGILAAVVSATPLSRDKRFAGVYTSAMANPFFPAFGGAFAGNPFGGGVFAGNPFVFPGFGFPAQTGVNRNPFFPAMPDYSSFVPFFIPEFKNWYEGPNVCKEEKITSKQMEDDGIPAEWKDGMPDVKTDFSHEQKSCKGNNGRATNNKYLCVERIYGNNGEAQIKVTKYECCHGFVPDPTGAPGCVESKESGASQGTNTKLTQSDPTYYVYSGNTGSSSSSSSVSRSSSGNLDKVPLQ